MQSPLWLRLRVFIPSAPVTSSHTSRVRRTTVSTATGISDRSAAENMCRVSIVCSSCVQLEAAELLKQSRWLGHSQPSRCQFRCLSHPGHGSLICLAVIDSQGFQLEQRSPLKREIETSPSWHILAGSIPCRPLGIEYVVFYFFFSSPSFSVFSFSSASLPCSLSPALSPPEEKCSLSPCYNSHYLIVLDFPSRVLL